MNAILLRLLLSLCLVANAVSAPWAMARMQHDLPGSASAESEISTAATDLHAHHAEHAGRTTQESLATGAADAHGGQHPACCSDSGCECGCILTLLIPIAPVRALASLTSVAPAPQYESQAAPGRSSPPFRPPAGWTPA